MDSFNQTTGFRYNPSSNRMSHHSDDESEFSGILDTYVHHARNFQNIFIYDNQDVYAKFSLAYNPDETLSTGIIKGGGKNPDFNENLRLKITQVDAGQKLPGMTNFWDLLWSQRSSPSLLPLAPPSNRERERSE